VLGDVVFKEPRIPVYSNVTAQPFEGAASVPGMLARQLVEPVRWEDILVSHPPQIPDIPTSTLPGPGSWRMLSAARTSWEIDDHRMAMEAQTDAICHLVFESKTDCLFGWFWRRTSAPPTLLLSESCSLLTYYHLNFSLSSLSTTTPLHGK